MYVIDASMEDEIDDLWVEEDFQEFKKCKENLGEGLRDYERLRIIFDIRTVWIFLDFSMLKY